ncbi:MAG: hypothetical protein IJK28_10150, partial [Clostridia bacterium]|nr:hypothetical protein [Clostridia bacterium]
VDATVLPVLSFPLREPPGSGLVWELNLTTWLSFLLPFSVTYVLYLNTNMRRDFRAKDWPFTERSGEPYGRGFALCGARQGLSDRPWTLRDRLFLVWHFAKQY